MRTLPFALVLALAAVPSPARADAMVRRTLQFLGFTEDGSQYLLKVADADTGDALSLRLVATGKAAKTLPLEDRAGEAQAIEAARKKFRVTDAGLEQPQSPDGKYTLLLVPKGGKVQVRALRGERFAVVKSLEAREGPDGPPRLVLKTVFWSKDGRKVVLMVHRTQRGDRDVDADEALPFEFFPSELDFGGTP
jgi:hypothetical protein